MPVHFTPDELERRRRRACRATGYSMGTTCPPSWMDWPMFYHGNPAIIEAGMVFFIHSVLMDEERGLSMAPGQSCVAARSGAETLSKMPLDLVVN